MPSNRSPDSRRKECIGSMLSFRPAPSHPGWPGQWLIAGRVAAYSCGAVADLHRLPVHSTAGGIVKQQTQERSSVERVADRQEQKRAPQWGLRAIARRLFPRSRIKLGVPGRSPGSCYSEEAPSHPGRPEQWLAAASNAITVAGPRWIFTRLPYCSNGTRNGS